MRIVSFVNETKDRVIDELVKASETGKCVKTTSPFKVGEAHVAVIRGGAIEKAVVTHLEMRQVPTPLDDKPQDYMVFQMEIFPENPNCPMGHFNTEWSLSGEGPYNMNLDIFPAVEITEDIDEIKAVMDNIADNFKIDRDTMREGLTDHYNMPHWDKPLASNVGCKLQNLNNEQLDLFIASYNAFFEKYLEILKRRSNTPFTDADTSLKRRRNGKWLEYIAIKDRAIKMGLATGIPPEVIINLSFPPSAIF
jgi:coproporphyrinogen III oxidase